MGQTPKEKAIHASRIKATEKAPTLLTRTFKRGDETVTVEAKTKRGVEELKKAKSIEDVL